MSEDDEDRPFKEWFGEVITHGWKKFKEKDNKGKTRTIIKVIVVAPPASVIVPTLLMVGYLPI